MFPRPSHQRGPADSVSNISQYSGDAGEDSRQQVASFFPVLRIVGGLLPGHAEGKEHAHAATLLS